MKNIIQVIRRDITQTVEQFRFQYFSRVTSVCFCLLCILTITPGFSASAATIENPSRHNNELIFATPDNESVCTRYMIKVFKEMSIRSGISCRVMELPKKRCLKEANQGSVAGLSARVAGLRGAGYENLIRLPTSIYATRHVVFLNKKELPEVRNLDDLVRISHDRDLVVAYMCGSVKALSLLTDLAESNMVCLDSPEQAFRMLSDTRISAFLSGPGVVGKAALNQLKTQYPDDEHLQCIVPAFVVSATPLFPYVHKKYENMVPLLDKALSSMKEDGTLQRLQNNML